MKTIRTGKAGDLELRLVETKDGKFVGVIFAANSRKAQIEGDDADDTWRRLHDEAAKANPQYFGFDGARARFVKFFPDGFRSTDYMTRERNFKIKAKTGLDAQAPVEKAATGSGFGQAVLGCFRATTLLSPFEKMRVQDLLRSPDADAFIRATARFALGDGKSALMDMEQAARKHECAKWTIATYLPYLWRPDKHMFLKPEVTKDFAERVGCAFYYYPKLDIAVYDSLLDLASQTDAEVAPLKPQDRIDIQSFIWVVGEYKEGG